jgi:hypothetical protein
LGRRGGDWVWLPPSPEATAAVFRFTGPLAPLFGACSPARDTGPPPAVGGDARARASRPAGGRLSERLAAEEEKLLKPKAKENQQVALKGPRNQRSGKIAKTSINTRREAAKTAGGRLSERLAAEEEKLLKPKAEANLRTRTGGVTSAKLPTSQPKVNTRREAAKTAPPLETLLAKLPKVFPSAPAGRPRSPPPRQRDLPERAGA